MIANIERFMAARHARRPDIETVLSFVLMRRNLDSLRSAIDLAATLRIDKAIGNHLHAYTSDMAEESLMLEPERYRRAYAALAEYRTPATGQPVAYRPPFTCAHRGAQHLPCSYPWATMAVLGNGDVMACCVPGQRSGTSHGSLNRSERRRDAAVPRARSTCVTIHRNPAPVFVPCCGCRKQLCLALHQPA